MPYWPSLSLSLLPGLKTTEGCLKHVSIACQVMGPLAYNCSELICYMPSCAGACIACHSLGAGAWLLQRGATTRVLLRYLSIYKGESRTVPTATIPELDMRTGGSLLEDLRISSKAGNSSLRDEKKGSRRACRAVSLCLGSDSKRPVRSS